MGEQENKDNANPDKVVTTTPVEGADKGNATPESVAKSQGNDHVPLWKLQKEKKKSDDLAKSLADTKAKLDTINAQKATEDGDLQKQLDAMKTKSEGLEAENIKLKDERRTKAVTEQILEEVNKHNPQNAKAVLKFIDQSELDINDSGAEIVVNGVGNLVEKLKESDPYLFTDKKDTDVDPAENGKQNDAKGGSAETEFAELHKKSQTKEGLTQVERVRFRTLAKEVKKLREDKEKKKS